MRVEFIASVSVITSDVDASHRLYRESLGLTFEGGDGDYAFTERLAGTKHFGIWPLSHAALACFGSEEWPNDVAVPNASIEFEVRDVAEASAELEASGFELIHAVKTEPWGQVTARLISPEGVLVAICRTPWFHEPAAGDAAQH